MKIFLLTVIMFNQTVAANLEKLSGLQGSDYVMLHSKVVDHDYHIYIKTPPQPEGEEGKKWPVVYLLDGGNTFPMFTPYAQYLVWAEDAPPVIMVGISYGTNDYRKGNKRSTDFTLPAMDREYYGGAEKFHQFLTSELFPLIEDKYPVNTKQRILFGHSLGGQFGLYNAMFQPQTFSGIIASNPAIHRNTDLFLKDVAFSDHQPKLFIMQAENDDERFKTPRKKWLDYWQEKPHHWRQNVMTAQGHSHMTSGPEAFRQGMKWLLSGLKE